MAGRALKVGEVVAIGHSLIAACPPEEWDELLEERFRITGPLVPDPEAGSAGRYPVRSLKTGQTGFVYKHEIHVPRKEKS